ncbi:hypothetical protein [Nocardia jejuensis]|uniref:hypothetical protein n=1 Tax=Nocardia jejuensis TaxID=328049 RepID=UPI000ADFE2C3|nr:hypothetical protein [Nocardia jejuensis]
MPDIAVTLMVILGFLGGALFLRALATAEPTRVRVRVTRPGSRVARAKMDE